MPSAACHRSRAAAAAATVLLAVLPSLLSPPAAGAATLQYWYGKVMQVADGDTLYVDIAGDSVPTLIPIRNLGIQATEVRGGTQPDGTECHANAARNAMAAFAPPGSWVRMSAYYAGSTADTDGAGRTRYWRYVDRWNTTTKVYEDVQAHLLKAGHVMWVWHATENARTATYHRYMQEAMAKRVGLWNDSACGVGPAESLDLRLWLHYDADGDDSKVLNKEWMRIQNRTATAVPLAGWKLRNGGHHFTPTSTYWTFPAEAAVPANGFITVYFGSGTTSTTAGKYYTNAATGPYLGNVVDPAQGYPGASIYLLDPDYDFRGVADYPCLVNCAKPALDIKTVQMKTTDEYVDVVVKAGVTTPQDLSGVVVTNDGWTKEIAPGTVLRPGEVLRVYCERSGTDTRLAQYWGPRTGTMLEDGGDTVVLRTAWSTTLDTYAWGSG